MKVYTFKDNMICEIPFEDVRVRDRCWIRCINPTLGDLEKISKLTRIPFDEFQESIEETERPRLSVSKYIEVIYMAPYPQGEEATLPIYFYIYNRVVITIEKERNSVLERIESKLRQNKLKFLLRRGVGYFLYYIIDQINDEFLMIIDKITDNLDIFKKKDVQFTEDTFEKMYDSSMVSAFFNQALRANLEVLNSLKKTYHRVFTEKDRNLFTELYFDATQILDTESIQRDMISSIFSLQSIIITNKLNNFMKKLTTLGLIILVPAVISSIYGMNFKYLPFANHPFGFYIILVLMFLITLVFYLFGKRMKWL